MADGPNGTSWTGRRVLVTGAASGIGRTTAIAMGRRGAQVMVADIDLPAVTTVRPEHGPTGQVFEALQLDVTDAASCTSAVARCADLMGGLDVLVSCAGILTPGALADTSAADWEEVFRVNVLGTFQMCKEVIRLMAEGGGGVIVNLASAAGVAPTPRLAAYSASKAAVVMLTKSIALDYGGVGIRANCVCPGVVDTPMVRSQSSDEEHRREMAESARLHVLGRVGEADEVAELICFMASQECSFMTGSAVVFDGGLSLSTARSL